MTDLNPPSSRAEATSPRSTLPAASKLGPVQQHDLDRTPRSHHGGPGRLSVSLRQFFSAAGLHIVLVALSFMFVLPFAWMVLASLKDLSQIGVGSWLPKPPVQYQPADIIAPDRLLEQLRAQTLVEDEALRELAARSVEALPPKPWTPSATYQVRSTLSSVLNQWIAMAAERDQTLQTLAVEQPIPSPQTLEQQRVVDDLDQRRQAVDAGPEADQAHESALSLLNRRQLDDIVGDAVRPTRAFQWQNYLEVFRQIPFARYYINSIFVACWVTFLQVFTSSLAAFAFTRLDWRGRDKVFLLYLTTMMLPGLVMMIPNYQIMIYAGLVDTLAGLVLPAAFTAFGTFLLRQFMLTIPRSLDEAAEIDGASKWRVYWDVILPMSRPGLITLAIFTFMAAYHNFFWPLVMLKSEHNYTLPIGLLYFDSSAGQETNLLMAAVTMSVFPMIIVFVTLQKYLVKGIQLGAVKG